MQQIQSTRPIPHDPRRMSLPQHPPARRSARHANKWLLLGGVAVAVALLLFCAMSVLGAVVLINSNKIADGVSVAGVNIGGLSADDAEAVLREKLTDRTVTLRDGDRQWQSSFVSLGMTFDLAGTMEAARAAKSGQSVTPRYHLDLNQSQRGLVAQAEAVNIAAVPGRDAQDGRAMEIPVMLDRLRNNALGELGDGVFDLSMMVVEPPEIESVDTYTGARTTHVVQAGQELGLIAKTYGVDMNDIIALNNITNANLIYPGQELVIPASGVYQPDASDAPAAPLTSGKSIVVDTNRQRIYAYQDGQLIRSHLTSTGRAETPTVLGDYRIYVKHVKTNMRGPDYFLPDVPYTMYFYQGYGIHGTYWHNSFGRPMSHGCVNLPTEEAKWFFEFAEVGTLVRVI